MTMKWCGEDHPHNPHQYTQTPLAYSTGAYMPVDCPGSTGPARAAEEKVQAEDHHIFIDILDEWFGTLFDIAVSKIDIEKLLRGSKR